MKKSLKTKSHSDSQRNRRPQRRSQVRSRCYFDDKGLEPSQVGEDILVRFLTRRGKIRSKERSGLCAYHQRALARAIKRGRNLGTIPYRIVA
ncbi:MAG: ribosomal protein S18, small subunit ribosomal protein S18 [candidate division CPR1 bacterium GW2011_GWC1_49_13]|uniref:Ribosomal protein S18, small subunit ribosomal protein S18 n=1 Tax=candidate division CPR1 bacterium GW2011_GWC1_49_13 TaxID=1618342 RepID=A0A0G1VIC9_9BACT|nr:MAG: ribosomal protein S18, small subunit ribosomal protein S18 [candidate division CPR1 bacterium GW2011_GWC1_49_13]